MTAGAASVQEASATGPCSRPEDRGGDGSPVHARKSIEGSLKRLNLLPARPLGRGVLTGQIKQFEDRAAVDYRRNPPRFQGENVAKNLRLVERITSTPRDRFRLHAFTLYHTRELVACRL